MPENPRIILALHDEMTRVTRSLVDLSSEDDAWAVETALAELEKLSLPEALHQEVLSRLRRAAEDFGIALDPEIQARLEGVEPAEDSEPALLPITTENYPVLYAVLDQRDERSSGQIDALISLLDTRQQEIGTKEEELQTLREAQESLKQELAEAQELYNTLAQERDSLKAEVEALGALRAELAEAQQADLAPVVADLRAQLETAQARLATLEAERHADLARRLLARYRALRHRRVRGRSDEEVLADLATRTSETLADLLEDLEGLPEPSLPEAGRITPEDQEALRSEVEDPTVPNPDEAVYCGGRADADLATKRAQMHAALTEETEEVLWGLWRPRHSKLA